MASPPIRRAQAGALMALLVMAGFPIAAQDYRRIDTGRNAVTLPAATGLPSITDIAVAPGSGFSILHGREGNIHHFDGNGRLLRRIGRASDNSVTFERLRSHGWHGQLPWAQVQSGDELVVFDGSTGKVSTTIDMPRFGGRAAVQAITPGGAPLVFHYFRVADDAAPRFEYGYALLPGFGIAPKSAFAKVPTDECFLRLGDQRVQVPWCQQSQGVVAPDGEWVAVASSTPARGTESEAVRVTFLSTRGDTLSSLRVEIPVARVSAVDVAAYLRSEARSRGLTHDNELKLKSAVAAQPHYPIAEWLISTNDRTVWLVQQTASATHYIVVDTEGRVVGRYSTAANLRLMAVAGRTAFGVRTLANGSEQVVRIAF